ncbi:MAG: ribbon-helix-helix domain-containing protein [Planctomycetaceae bacterium]|nr:ribbon-helix-helix domain-containing protein [Planctomycetaceae bacterium]
MTLTLSLPPDLEERLADEATKQGTSPDELTLRILAEHLPNKGRQAQLAALLQSWMDSPDEAEQKETGDFLVRALDEDRLSNRKLFPPELEGVTW